MKAKKVLLLGLLVGTMALVGCNGGGNDGKSSSKKPSGDSSSQQPSSQEESKLPKYEVKFVGADGAEISKENLERGSKLTKPADPTAPAGKAFYGWMNVKNGGQIWDFEHDDINIVLQDVELKPCFVDASLEAQYLEGELCPDITNFGVDGNGDIVPMDGATYSGGQKGKGLIYRAYDGEFGAHGAYIREDVEIDGKEVKGKARYAREGDPAGDIFGGFVHFMYIEGDRLTWEIESDVAAENVTLFMRLSGEYGLDNEYDDKVSFKFSDEMFKVKVNDVPLKYGEVTIANVEAKTFINFQDYMVSANVSLKAGKNVIQMLVDNHVSLDGTIASTAPCVDCIKLYSPSTITWADAQIDNLSK